MLLILTNGNYDIPEATAQRIELALTANELVVEIDLDLFGEANPSPTVLALRHVVAIVDYRRPEAHIAGLAAGKVRSLVT